MSPARPVLALLLLALPAGAEDAGPFAVREWRVPGRVVDVFAARGEDGRDVVFAISLVAGPPAERRYVTPLPHDLSAPAHPIEVPRDVVFVTAVELGQARGPELVWLSARALRVVSARGEPLAEWPVKPALPLPARTWELAHLDFVRDWDSDGRLEALAPSTEGARLLPLVPGDGTQELDLPLVADYGTPTLENYFKPGFLVTSIAWPMLALADDDGDGRPDLFAANRYELRVFRAGADGLPREPTRRRPFPPFTVEEERRHLASTLLAFVRDLDGDGRADLVVHRMVGELMRSRTTTTVHLNKGGGADPMAPPSSRADRSGGNSAVRLDDLDGDGRVEILEAYVPFGVVQAVRMLTLQRVEAEMRVLELPPGGGAPVETWSADVSFPFDFSTSRVRGLLPYTEADWNGDGRADLCWGDGSGALRFRLGEARASGPGFGPIVGSVPLGITGELASADLDGDGLADFVAYDPLDTDGRLRVAHNRGVLPGTPAGLRAVSPR